MNSLETLLQKFFSNPADLEFQCVHLEGRNKAWVMVQEMNNGWRLYRQVDESLIFCRQKKTVETKVSYGGHSQEFGGVDIYGADSAGKEFKITAPDLLTKEFHSKIAKSIAAFAYQTAYAQGRSDFEMDIHNRNTADEFQKWWNAHGIPDAGEAVNAKSHSQEESGPLTYDKVKGIVLSMAAKVFGLPHGEMDDLFRVGRAIDRKADEFRLEVERRFGFYFEQDCMKMNTVGDVVMFVAKFHGCDLPQATA